ncbi:MAG: hypothetical protein U1D96_08480 [Eubacteriales bacterium]|nr:hypothetical protein [Bacillota bacterium]MBV1727624.1 hypothetical protein [Desulforudis sp.]MDP3050185.1 hypothetical protein [Eubacteriales bacterium]MDQ7789763.1 hypothetical protein [Clostridia bacterium]MBU4532686.1 hypothetical protein [Bacillota bacterium]
MADKNKHRDEIVEPEHGEKKDRDMNVAGRVWEAAKEAVGTGNVTNPDEKNEFKKRKK